MVPRGARSARGIGIAMSNGGQISPGELRGKLTMLAGWAAGAGAALGERLPAPGPARYLRTLRRRLPPDGLFMPRK